MREKKEILLAQIEGGNPYTGSYIQGWRLRRIQCIKFVILLEWGNDIALSSRVNIVFWHKIFYFFQKNQIFIRFNGMPYWFEGVESF